MDVGRIAEAANIASGFVRLDPAEPHFWRQLVQVERCLGDTEKEFIALKKLAEIEPSAPWTHEGLSVIYEKRGDMPAVLSAARTASKLAPKNDHFRNHVLGLEGTA